MIEKIQLAQLKIKKYNHFQASVYIPKYLAELWKKALDEAAKENVSTAYILLYAFAKQYNLDISPYIQGSGKRK